MDIEYIREEIKNNRHIFLHSYSKDIEYDDVLIIKASDEYFDEISCNVKDWFGIKNTGKTECNKHKFTDYLGFWTLLNENIYNKEVIRYYSGKKCDRCELDTLDMIGSYKDMPTCDEYLMQAVLL